MKTHFDHAMGTVPAPTVDVDALIARGRRGTRYRRLGASAGGVGAVAALVAVALWTGVPGGPATSGRPVQPAGPGGSVNAPAGSAAPTGSAAAAADRGTSPRQTERRLSAGLAELVREQLPTVRASTDDPQWPALVVKHQVHPGDGIGPGVRHVQEDYFFARAQLTTEGGMGEFVFMTGVIGPGFKVATSCEDNKDETCAVRTGPGGETIVQIATTGAGSDLPESRSYRVSIRKADGTGVLLDANNGRVKGAGAKITRRAPVLSADQLIAIGTDPRLRLSH